MEPSRSQFSPKPGQCSHDVQFYESDSALAESVADFIAAGLAAAEPAIIVATASHRELFLRALANKNCDVEAARGDGCLCILDAHETLASFTVGATLDADLFRCVVGGAVESLARRTLATGKVRAFGEMVDVLWQEHNHQAALRLEEMWNELAGVYSFDLLCAYSMGGFYKGTAGEALHEVCDRHARVIPPLGSSEVPADQTSATIRSLVAEIGHRRDVERALRACLQDVRRAEQRERTRAHRTAQLQRATARLAATLTDTDVANTLLSVTAETMQATAGVVYLRDSAGELRLRAALAAPVPGGVEIEHWGVLPPQIPVPLATAIADRYPMFLGTPRALVDQYPTLRFSDTSGSSVQALAAIPLLHGSRVVGGFVVTFDVERDFDDEERRLLEGVAGQAALAAERARLYEAEKQAREAQARVVGELEQTVLLNELFVGVLAHDLRSPLAAMVTAGELLKSRGATGPEPRNERVLNRILSSGRRMTRMIEQLLDFTRLRLGGRLTLDRCDVDLGSLIRQIVGELEDTHPEWAIKVEQTGDALGQWDVDRLGQVFSNLLANAVQHGRFEGGVQVRIEAVVGDTVRVQVHNQGEIPSEILSRVFQPLTGGDRHRHGSRGLGLGLFITKEIAQAHGGDVSVASSEGQGTTFTLSLPRRPDRRAADADTVPGGTEPRSIRWSRRIAA